MSVKADGSKAGRRERHLARQAALKERKVLRRKRAAIHVAMGAAAKRRKSRKRGISAFDGFMADQGFVPVDGYTYEPHNGYVVTLSDVLDKYEARP